MGMPCLASPLTPWRACLPGSTCWKLRDDCVLSVTLKTTTNYKATSHVCNSTWRISTQQRFLCASGPDDCGQHASGSAWVHPAAHLWSAHLCRSDGPSSSGGPAQPQPLHMLLTQETGLRALHFLCELCGASLLSAGEGKRRSPPASLLLRTSCDTPMDVVSLGLDDGTAQRHERPHCALVRSPACALTRLPELTCNPKPTPQCSRRHLPPGVHSPRGTKAQLTL